MRPWLWASVEGGYVLAVAALQVMMCAGVERERERARRRHRALCRGEQALINRLRQVEGLQRDLTTVHNLTLAGQIAPPPAVVVGGSAIRRDGPWVVVSVHLPLACGTAEPVPAGARVIRLPVEQPT